MDKTKNGVAGMPPVKLPPAEPAAGKGKPDLKTPPPLGKPRSDVKTLNVAGVPEIIFQRKGGPAPAATPLPGTLGGRSSVRGHRSATSACSAISSH